MGKCPQFSRDTSKDGLLLSGAIHRITSTSLFMCGS